MNSDKYDSDVWPNDYVYGLQKKTLELGQRIAALEAERESIRQAFGIGKGAFNQSVLMKCVSNVLRRNSCLSGIENYLTEMEIDEDGEAQSVPILNWGEEPDAYITRFRKAVPWPLEVMKDE